MALAAALAHAPTASTKDVDEPPLTPSYPPSRSPGTKRAVGGEGMRGETHARGRPLADGRWMLKRSEHLRRWNKRWVSLDETGESVIIKANPADEKALSSVRLADVRCAPPAPPPPPSSFRAGNRRVGLFRFDGAALGAFDADPGPTATPR